MIVQFKPIINLKNFVDMKTLYESILSSTASGSYRYAEEIIKWFKGTREYISVKDLVRKDIRVECVPVDKAWKIMLYCEQRIPKDAQWCIDGWDCPDYGSLPYNIYGIYYNDNPLNITYREIHFKSSDEIVKEVNYFLALYGCGIYTLDKLPKGCECLKINRMNDPSGGSPCQINTIKDIKVDTLEFGEKYSVAPLLLSDIKNITVKKELQITNDLLCASSYENALKNGDKSFTLAASEILDTFFKNNHVKSENCVFISIKRDPIYHGLISGYIEKKKTKGESV